jgi:hypothetical protein
VAVGQFINTEEPDPISSMRCANVCRRKSLPRASVPERGQVAKYSVEKSSPLRAKQARDVLEQRELGSYIPKHPSAFVPKVALVGAGESLSGG